MTIAYPIDSTRRRRGIEVAFPDFPDALVQCAAGEEMDAAGACLVDGAGGLR